jgi:RHS repeat-associated protein
MAYDAWGSRRDLQGDAGVIAVDANNKLQGVPLVDNKGFTGQEELDQLGLVHLNGRIYDPLIGRFLSADPEIQDPMHSQSYNRYTYVWNNPTNDTDPTGFSKISDQMHDAQGWNWCAVCATQIADANAWNDVMNFGGPLTLDFGKSSGGDTTNTVQSSSASSQNSSILDGMSGVTPQGGLARGGLAQGNLKGAPSELGPGYDEYGNYSGPRPDPIKHITEFQIGGKDFEILYGSRPQQAMVQGWVEDNFSTPLGKIELPLLEGHRSLGLPVPYKIKIGIVLNWSGANPDGDEMYLDVYYRPRQLALVNGRPQNIYIEPERAMWHEFGHSAFGYRDVDYAGYHDMLNVIAVENQMARHFKKPPRLEYCLPENCGH